MDRQTTLSNSKHAMQKQAPDGWGFQANGLSYILVLAAAAAWPVILEKCAPDHFLQGQSIYRAVRRHFRQKSLIDAAMQTASDGTVQLVPIGSTSRSQNVIRASRNALRGGSGQASLD
jgi:hypothetical protein